MRKSADIYNYKRILKRALVRLENSEIDRDSKLKIKEFIRECSAQGFSQARIVKYATTLIQCAELLGKPFSKADKDDLIAFVQKIEGKDYSD